ncbi:hypothetical protein [Pyrinomonas sp.]|uniref:hypothetical protein n=1 Tax=Pyrinomonas sp. TaxID=2080306 RepID=UPI0033254E12
MRREWIQIVGIAWTLVYAAFIVWLYAAQPRNLGDVATSASVAVGAYKIDEERFQAGLGLFRREQYAAAREEWKLADPAQRDARTQFYVAYAFYREGWGRVYNDDQLLRQGLAAAERAIELSGGALRADDPELKIQTPVELKAEIERELRRDWSYLNPLKVLRERK